MNKSLNERLLSDLPDDVQKYLVDMVTSVGTSLAQGVMTWGFEVVKHLSVINAAGLAGSVALYSSPAKTAALGALSAFLIGLVLAIIVMVTIYMVGLAYLVVFHKRLMGVLFGAQGIVKLRPPLWFLVVTAINWALVVASIIAFIIGVCRLAKVV
ncbi:MAG TPA: hypothetical protein VM512_05885 [Burkholderiaceae bacterium]|nr:hypothetical protein [Burkholderiaceae bacterium]